MKCEFCSADEPLPFVCNYCGGVFCANHRLPEAHMCKGDLSVKRTVAVPPSPATTASSSNWTGERYSFRPKRGLSGAFSRIEIRDIVVAWVGLGLAFFIAYSGGGFGLGKVVNYGPLTLAVVFLVSLVTVGSGFVLHELSHKFAARRYGYWAEFRVWPMGLVLALFTSLIGFIFAAPGATYISGINITKSENGVISLAGPLTNVLVAAVFLPFLLVGGMPWYLHLLGYEGVFVNTFLALFNMLPIMPLDGAKVFGWNRLIWAAIFVPLAIFFVLSVY